MYHQIKQTTLALSLCLSTTVVFAQQTVKGTVQDANGDPMIGVSIFVDGNTAAISDLDGHFSLSSVKPQSKVKVSYVGYMDQTVTVGNNKRIEIVMQEDNQTLNDVVVIGYGSMKKGDLTGSVSSVNSEQVQSRGVTSVSEALQGSVPGVSITQKGSRPGGSVSMQIRGQSSINTQASPLYVIDGVVCSSMDFLNPDDIDRIDVLKDASSTAIYGSQPCLCRCCHHYHQG